MANGSVVNALINSYMPQPGDEDLMPPTAGHQNPERDVNSILSIAGARLSDRLSDAGVSIAKALMAPGNAAMGQYDQRPVYADGSVGMFDPRMEEDVVNLAGLVSLGAAPIPRPAGSLNMGLASRPRNLPFSESLSLPPAPSVEQLQSLARVEKVPLAQARATNSLQWERFDAGDHPPPMAEGFSDRPIAVRKENGEYLIYDGHHRIALAASKGLDEVDMYVVDAKDYAPMDAGRKPQSSNPSISDDELLRMLFE